MVPIYFYLSARQGGEKLPSCIADFDTNPGSTPIGEYVWILQTYLWLKEFSFPCQLVRTIPDHGIIVASREGLPYGFKPSTKQFIVCTKGDQNPHPYAHIHIVQNPQEATSPSLYIQSRSHDRYLLPGPRHFIPLWPQPRLIPRNPQRGKTFERIGYFGISDNIAPEMQTQTWRQALADLGLVWATFRDSREWSSYADIDAIVAVRQFNSVIDYSWKPPTKLYNAWHGQVPAILGAESAYRSQRKSALDYLEVNHVDELIAALAKLKQDSDLRQAMVENGRIRAQETTPEALVNQWTSLLLNVCQPSYERWIQRRSIGHQQFLLKRTTAKRLCQGLKSLSSKP